MNIRSEVHADLPEYGRVRVILFQEEEFYLGEERMDKEALSLAEEEEEDGLSTDGVCTVCGETVELECDQKTGTCEFCNNKVVFDSPSLRRAIHNWNE